MKEQYTEPAMEEAVKQWHNDNLNDQISVKSQIINNAIAGWEQQKNSLQTVSFPYIDDAITKLQTQWESESCTKFVEHYKDFSNEFSIIIDRFEKIINSTKAALNDFENQDTSGANKVEEDSADLSMNMTQKPSTNSQGISYGKSQQEHETFKENLEMNEYFDYWDNRKGTMTKEEVIGNFESYLNKNSLAELEAYIDKNP